MWPNPQETTGLVTFSEKFLNGKLHFLCSAWFASFLKFGSLLSKNPRCAPEPLIVPTACTLIAYIIL